MSDDLAQLKDEEKEKLIQIEKGDVEDAGENKTAVSQHQTWIPGVILIAIGVIFLATNLGGFHLNNLWALFILIPAVSNFSSAWQNYKTNGRLQKSGRGSITGGLILTLISFTFLFGWDWGVIWPLFLIIGGVGALLGSWFD